MYRKVTGNIMQKGQTNLNATSSSRKKFQSRKVFNCGSTVILIYFNLTIVKILALAVTHSLVFISKLKQ